MPSIIKHVYNFTSLAPLSEIVNNPKYNIPEPIYSALILIAEHNQTKKNTAAIEYIKEYTNENGVDSNGFYKYNLYIAIIDKKQYQCKIDLGIYGLPNNKVVLSTLTFP